ncbi:MAG: GAG-pre-integrase domain-containing protein, partial [Rhodoglobus sp.]
MKQYLTLAGLFAVTEANPLPGKLRASPGDSEGGTMASLDPEAIGTGSQELVKKSVAAYEMIQDAICAGNDPATAAIVRVADIGNAHELWSLIRAHHTELGGQTLIRLTTELLASKQRTHESATAFGYRVITQAAELEAEGRPLPAEMVSELFVNGLRMDQAPIAMQLAIAKGKSTLQQLVALATTLTATMAAHSGMRGTTGAGVERATRPHQANEAAIVTERQGKVNPDIICHHCKMRGHPKHKCPQLTQDRRSGPPSTDKGKGYCDFCERGGHATKDCRRMQKAKATAAPSAAASAQQTGSSDDEEPDTWCVSYCATAMTGIEEKGPKHEYIFDSGASNVCVTDEAALTDLKPATCTGIRVASGEVLARPKSGTLAITLAGGRTMEISGALAHPGLRTNLLGCSTVVDQEGIDHITIRRDAMRVHASDGTVVMTAPRRNGVYIWTRGEITEAHAIEQSGAQLWHERLGHFSLGTLHKAAQAGTIVEGNEFKLPKGHQAIVCGPCIQGMHKRLPYGTKLRKGMEAKAVLDRVHADLAGPFGPSWDGKIYRLDIIDE